MFIFNFKVNKNLFSKLMFLVMLIVIIAIFVYGVYVIFIKDTNTITVQDSIKGNEIFEITEKNYANILKVTNENIDSYVGLKVHITGYVYRLLNFKENQFVVARNMQLNNNHYVVVGFLAEYDKASDFKDGTWVDVIGKIKKGNFAGDIAILDIISISPTEEPENSYVSLPDESYIPTSNMF